MPWLGGRPPERESRHGEAAGEPRGQARTVDEGGADTVIPVTDTGLIGLIGLSLCQRTSGRKIPASDVQPPG